MNFITRWAAWVALNRRDAAKLVALGLLLTASGVAMGWLFDRIT
jgi:hypothetical protein